ncbi:MAG: hypothetical protein JST86_14785 [Bacteroidetes bacterium]|nr:hypothetical protein [Bacteroidota bacterium]
MMSVIPKLASSLKRRDEIPNQELARQIAARKDQQAVQELVDHLSHKSKDIQNDCIKVLYEIGAVNPSLIARHAQSFIALLDHKNNRLQWGGMTALHCITPENPRLVAAALDKILAAANMGSVITKDYAVNILIALCALQQYETKIFPLLVEQLLNSPSNQLPMYAEKAMPIINDKNKTVFIKALTSRLNDIEKDTKRKRVEAVIRKVSSK